jgi:protein TonB
MKIRIQKIIKTGIFLFVLFNFSPIYSQNNTDIKFPVYPGCEMSQEKMKCMRNKIIETVSTHFNTETLNEIKERPIIVETTFTITNEGEIEINEVKTPYKNIQIEIIKVLSMIPPIKPAEKNGVPISIQYKIPLVFQ